MENQHRKIKGYRELSEEEINLMNMIKKKGSELETLLESIEKLPNLEDTSQVLHRKECLVNATKDLKQGIMWTVRSIALPESF